MIEYKQRKKRFYEEMNEEQLYDVLKTKFLNKTLKIKYDIEERDIQLNEMDDTTRRIMLVTDESYLPGTDNLIMVSGLVDKYFEVEFDVIENLGPGYFACKIKGGRKATTGRGDLRFKVNEDDAVASNFRVSKHTIDVSNLTIPTSVKVVLDQFNIANKSSCDYFEVNVFEKQDTVLDLVKKTGKTVWIEDLASDEPAPIFGDDLLDLREVFGNDYNRFAMKIRERGFRSMVVVPIIYVMDSEASVPFGYIRMLSKEKLFGLEDVLRMKAETFKLIDRIRDATTIMLPVKQRLLDISRGGARLQINNDELKLYISRAKGFVFDIIFKLQAPITIYGEIKFTALDEDKNLILGLSFAGNSSRKNEMKHLYDILEPMEVEYKKRLIKQMQARRGIGGAGNRR